MKVLFVTARPPWPSRRGDQARAAAWIEGLRSSNPSGPHQVRLLALRPAGFPQDFPNDVQGQTFALSRTGMLSSPLRRPRLPLQVAMHVHRGLQKALDNEIEVFQPDVIVPVLSRVGWLRIPREIPVVLDLVDSLALNMENRARQEPLLRWLWLWEAQRMAAWDRRLVERAAAAVVVAERDRAAVIDQRPDLAQRVEVLPFGLPVTASPPTLGDNQEIVLLSGNLGYFPTVDAAGYFATEVWPRLRSQRPNAEWWLAGARPAPAIRRLADLPGVRVIADPVDLGAVRRQARVAIVPLRSGSGTPIKVLEAMADGIPLVVTPAAADGLDKAPADAAVVTDDAAAMADAIAHLLADPTAAEEQCRKAWEWVRQRHGLDRVVSAFESLLRRVVEER